MRKPDISHSVHTFEPVYLVSHSLFVCLYAVTQIDLDWVHRHSANGNLFITKKEEVRGINNNRMFEFLDEADDCLKKGN